MAELALVSWLGPRVQAGPAGEWIVGEVSNVHYLSPATSELANKRAGVKLYCSWL